MFDISVVKECKLCGEMFPLNEDGWCQGCEDYRLLAEIESMEVDCNE